MSSLGGFSCSLRGSLLSGVFKGSLIAQRPPPVAPRKNLNSGLSELETYRKNNGKMGEGRQNWHGTRRHPNAEPAAQAEKGFMLSRCVGVTWAAEVHGERMNNLVLTFMKKI